MKAFSVAVMTVGTVLLMAATPCRAQSIIRGENDPADGKSRQLVLPFAFYTDATDFAFGVGGGMSGAPQPQSFLGAAVFGSTNGSFGVYAMQRDLQLRPLDRLFLDGNLFLTRYAESEEFVDGNPAFPGRAGANGSDADDFVEAETFSGRLEAKFKYVLPIGHAASNPIATYTLSRGLIVDGVSGGTAFNPLASGRTTIDLMPFAYWRRLDANHDQDVLADDEFDSFGVNIGLRWDNTDFPANPTTGNIFDVHLARDFGILTSDAAYTNLEVGYSHYLDLGSSRTFRQMVIALDGWTSSELAGDAPYYTGATLGGYNRMRGYAFNRFNGRAALYASAELRLTPDWNPLKSIDAIEKIAEVDWMQFVVFGELGRVAQNYSADLFDDPRWDVGVGIRVLARKIVLRADFAIGEEGFNAWVMIGHAF